MNRCYVVLEEANQGVADLGSLGQSWINHDEVNETVTKAPQSPSTCSYCHHKAISALIKSEAELRLAAHCTKPEEHGPIEILFHVRFLK